VKVRTKERERECVGVCARTYSISKGFKGVGQTREHLSLSLSVSHTPTHNTSQCRISLGWLGERERKKQRVCICACARATPCARVLKASDSVGCVVLHMRR